MDERTTVHVYFAHSTRLVQDIGNKGLSSISVAMKSRRSCSTSFEEKRKIEKENTRVASVWHVLWTEQKARDNSRVWLLRVLEQKQGLLNERKKKSSRQKKGKASVRRKELSTSAVWPYNLGYESAKMLILTRLGPANLVFLRRDRKGLGKRIKPAIFDIDRTWTGLAEGGRRRSLLRCLPRLAARIRLSYTNGVVLHRGIPSIWTEWKINQGKEISFLIYFLPRKSTYCIQEKQKKK